VYNIHKFNQIQAKISFYLGKYYSACNKKKIIEFLRFVTLS